MRNFDAKYLKAAVYGANDGIVTTFAVVSGVVGAQLPIQTILILGVANMFADGVSMALGDYLGERSEQRLRKQRKQEHREDGLWKTGVVTFISFVLAGSLPLIPYLLQYCGALEYGSNQFLASILATAGALFFVGSMRTFLTKGSFIKNGLEMLVVGAFAAGIAYLAGAWIKRLIV